MHPSSSPRCTVGSWASRPGTHPAVDPPACPTRDCHQEYRSGQVQTGPREDCLPFEHVQCYLGVRLLGKKRELIGTRKRPPHWIQPGDSLVHQSSGFELGYSRTDARTSMLSRMSTFLS